MRLSELELARFLAHRKCRAPAVHAAVAAWLLVQVVLHAYRFAQAACKDALAAVAEEVHAARHPEAVPMYP
eukprot:CAMPEP_0202909710 /NCGR_PEP_ID=MMETSP1392-20130828/50125_1 /ASSEMBLY_ACC=CAM_ASM_000868 /TAXON_ID=225041 /ORGANISM="Chlamydomonas chlamydogama, Strain SAG 11-48b" /LENGTH=70 /DNA_ID=CAMNT_0049599561 /DNA_START=479 /DNA_END=688 /DNA_ORIENTATION=+